MHLQLWPANRMSTAGLPQGMRKKVLAGRTGVARTQRSRTDTLRPTSGDERVNTVRLPGQRRRPGRQ
jgi:hypothetical protein